MKSFKKLMHFNSGKAKVKHNGSQGSPDSRHGSEASKEMQELRELRKQYEGLFEVSNMVSSRALEFSNAIQQLAMYLINTFGSIEDGETGKVFKIVGRVQSEMSKILDLYAAQVLQTLTEPTETLLSELQNVEDSRRQHDEKRQLYEQLRARIVKGRPKNGKGEAFADQQLQVVKDEFDKLSMFVNARLVSLEQSRPRSLITQAARHHSAQMHLFSRGHAALQAVEPYMRQVARERNIDREISLTRHGLNDNDFESDSNDDDDVSYMDELDTSDSQSLERSSRWNSRISSPEQSPNILDEGVGVPKNLTKEWNSMLLRSNRSIGDSVHARQSGDYSHVRSNSGDQPNLREGSVFGSGPTTPRLDGSGFGSGATTPRLAEQGRASSFSPGYHSSKSAPLTTRGLPIDEDDSFSATDDTFHPGEAREDVESNQGETYTSPPAYRQPPEVPPGPARGTDGVGFSATSSEYTSHSVSTSGRTSLDNHYHTSDPDLSAGGMQSDSSGVSSKYSHKSSGFTAESVQAKSPSDQKLPSPKQQPPVSLLENPPVVSFVSPPLSSTPVGFTSNTIDSRRRDLKRYSQSGPLTFNGMPWSSQPSLGSMGPNTSSQSGANSSSDLHRSGPLGRSPLGRTFGSPRISPCISPPRMSPPIISELHKLPPPPLDHINSTSSSSRSSNIIAHSAPLSRHSESPTSQSSVRATPLPPPPLGSMPRSLSMPARQKIQQYQQRSKPPTIPQVLEVSDEESASPSEKNSSAGGRTFSSQDRTYLPRASSPTKNFSVQEVGFAPANLKFIHVDASRTPSGASTPRSQQHIRPPSPSALSRVSVDSQPHTPSLKSASPRTSRWRSLSISDTDSYLHNAAKGAVF